MPPVRPITGACLCFLAGLLTAIQLRPDPTLVLPLALAILCACAVQIPRSPDAAMRAAGIGRTVTGRRAASRQMGLLLAGWALLGAGLGSHASREAVADCRGLLADGAVLQASGRLAGGAYPGSGGDAARPLHEISGATVTAAAAEAGCAAASLRVRLPPDARLAAGTEIRLQGEWVRSKQAGATALRPRFAGLLLADSVEVVATSSASSRPLLALRGRAEQALHKLYGPHGATVAALLLGRREHLDPALRESFVRAGLAHLLAISGMHVGLLAGVLLLLGTAARLPRTVLPWVVMLALWAYLLLIGAPPSAARAGLMISLALASRLLQRPAAVLPIVCTAALVLLAVEPLDILDIGFQLSFFGVLGILVARRLLLERVPYAWRRGAVRRAAVEGTVISLGAFVATVPLSAYHFGAVAPVSLLANLPAVPLLSLAVSGAAASLALYPLLPGLAALLADGTSLSLVVLTGVAEGAGRVPYGYLAVAPVQVLSVSAAAAVGVAAARIGRGIRAPVRGLAGVGVCTSVLLLWTPVSLLTPGPLEIHFLDVGQGDATAIRTPRGRWVLIDAGPKGRGYDAGERRVLPFLRSRGARGLEALILTHPDADHMGGVAAVVGGLRVVRVVDPGQAAAKEMYAHMLAAVERHAGAWERARVGRSLEVDGVVFRFLWPPPETLDAAADANQISAVVLVEFGEFRMLAPGDAPADVERLLVGEHGRGLRAQVLKAGHHGSSTSTADTLLAVVAPELAVVSAGRRNRYGHPHPDVLGRLTARGVEVARTDREGTVAIRVEAGGRRWRRLDE